jgi:hypothetical protein
VLLAVDATDLLLIFTLGPGALVVLAALYKGYRWFFPPEPLVAFGHPEESQVPGVLFVGDSDAEWKAQLRRYEEARLASLSISYLIESKDTTAVRDLTTGVRSLDGNTEYVHQPCLVQILAPGEKVDVSDLSPPKEMYAGMTDENRAENFLFWARFRDSQGRRWEAEYDPRTRTPTYKLLSRGAFLGRRH